MTRAQQIELLAIQLHYVRSDGAECADVDSGGSKTPERWSPLRAKKEFEDLPEEMQKAWFAYAERIAPFCGIELVKV